MEKYSPPFCKTVGKRSSYNIHFKENYSSLIFLKFKTMKTLKLFNAVLAKESDAKAFISEDGFMIEPDAVWAKKKLRLITKRKAQWK
ncbi:SAM-dependent DNA methyltransferase [Chryseobacterium sp. 3008163]|nr:SAM-dependent DNA methyltransferase [Chryseobacterium sp. 3008163]